MTSHPFSIRENQIKFLDEERKAVIGGMGGGRRELISDIEECTVLYLLSITALIQTSDTECVALMATQEDMTR